MKKNIALLLSALAIAGCNLNTQPDVDINYNSKYCVLTDSDGKETVKTEFVEVTNLKETIKEYNKVDGNWEFTRKVVSERTFDSYGNAAQITTSYYDTSDRLTGVSKSRYEYSYMGNRPETCTVSEEVDGEWVDTQRREFFYEFGNNLVSSTVNYDLVAHDGTVPESMDEYAYTNGIIAACTRYVFKEDSQKWATLFAESYVYDDYGRLTSKKVEYPSVPELSYTLTYFY